MTGKELSKYWIDSAEEDYNAMINIYNAKQYNWSLFIGHLVIEKLLKSLYAKLNEKEPYAPKIHNLLTLAEKCNLELDDKKIEELSRITRFNMHARYEEAKESFYKLCTPQYTAEQIKVIEELRLWLKEKLV